jgi:hypothetical protein
VRLHAARSVPRAYGLICPLLLALPIRAGEATVVLGGGGLWLGGNAQP